MQARVLVVGGGVIGLASAWELARAGHAVTVVSPAPGRDGASWVAAGMLAPVTEAQFGEGALTELLLNGASRWKEFAVQLEEASGQDIGYDQSGTLTVAANASDHSVLLNLLAYQQSLGLTAHRRSATACRELVPNLAPTLRGGIEVPGDHHVDNRALLQALLSAAEQAGVRFVPDTVVALLPGPEVALGQGDRLRADIVLLAAGAGTPLIEGLGDAGLPDIRPVKGHVLRLGAPPGAPSLPLLPRTVRALVNGRSVYLVPRPDSSIVVGATVEERGYDDTVQAGAVFELLADARAIVPGIDEFTLVEASTGLRPATQSNEPTVGWTRQPGVAVATGHFRNGMLLAPSTADAVVALVAEHA